MAYKTILVHVDGSKRCPVRLEIAIRLARRFDAHLIGLHALTAMRLPAYALAEAGTTLIDARNAIARDQEALAEKYFREALDNAGLSAGEWRVSREDAVDAMALHGRYSDLMVLGQSHPDEGEGVDADFPERVVLATGRPALMIPYAGRFNSLGQRVLVAWNASREATRAVADAIPLLRDAARVNVVVFNPEGPDHGDIPGADIGLYLARQGVRVEVGYHHATNIDVGNQILSRAADLGSDLIVMGAYGHSRLRELVLGGASRTILASMTVPVLLAH